MRYLQWFAWAVSLPLQVFLLNSLVRGGFRRFPFLGLYTLTLFLWTVANIAARQAGRLPPAWAPLYWVIEVVLGALLYGLVLTLVHRALKGDPRRGSWMRILIIGVVLVWLGALMLTHSPRLNEWMTNFTKYTSFVGALMNMILWLTLIGKKHSDRALLMISGGYGIQSAGNAISQSLRSLSVGSRSYPILFTGNLIFVLTHCLCFLIWWRAVARENLKLSRRPD